MAIRLRKFNRSLLNGDTDLKSIARCGNALGSTILMRQGGDGQVRPGGIATCKSVWGCLGCAARRRALKSAMVKYYVQAHQTAGKGVSFGSFTLAHYPTDSLADLLEGLRKAFTDMRHLKVYKDAEADHGIIGWIAALEITHGRNGWHPHLHVLFFHEEHLEIEYGDNAELRGALHEAFARQIDRHLGRTVHQIHGVDLAPVRTTPRGDGDEALARYLGKIQLEMTRQDLKVGRATTSRSPWQIALDAADTGDARDAALWCEYLRATKGRNVVTSGGSLAAHYGEPTDAQLNRLLGGDQPMDDDQAHDNDPGEDIASISADVWTDLLNHRDRHTSPVTADAITALETDGPEAMAEVITDRLDKLVQVVTHHETGLPHLQYANLADRRHYVGQPDLRNDAEPIALDDLGPARTGLVRSHNQPIHGGGPMTADDPTARMIVFFGSCEAEHYAAKLQLRFAPLAAEDGRTRNGVARQVRKQVQELYQLFDQVGETFPITTDVPDLDTVDWGQLADLVTIDKDQRWN